MASRILLADDSITIQKVVNLTFADEGIEVVSVSNGDAAERRLPEVDPDLVLADIFMPGKNGYELCETIKAVPQYKDLPVVLLVGAFEPYNEVEARRVKADGHLTKPFESRVLVEMVRNLIASHPRKRETPAPQPTAPQPSAVTQPFSPILRPESSLDFAAMSDQIAPQPVPNPPNYFQNEPTFVTDNAGQAEESPIEFVTSPPTDNEATLPLSSFSDAHNQLKPALPGMADQQSDWSFNAGANAVVDYEKVEPAGASMNNSLPALEVDAVPPVDTAESSAASQQAFITILTEPSGQQAGEVSEGEPKKFDTSELPTPESEEGGKKFDTNELETPAATATEVAAQPPQPQPAATEPAVGSFGLEGVSEEEPLGDVLKGTMPLQVYEAGEEHSPLEIEEPVVAKPPVHDEAQIAGSPLNVGAFVDVAALRAQQDAAAQSSGTATEQSTSGTEASPRAEATAVPETGFNVVSATPSTEATAPTSAPPAESISADMWSIGLPTKLPGPDYAPAPPEETPAAPTEAKATEAPAAPTIEASQAVIEEIVRRVIAQLSDNVVREIAWEVVPDCVERVVTNLTKEKMAESK
jgi:CheY-like chemotaxis protein